MKRLIFACAAIAAGLCTYAAHAAPSKCFANPAAVFAAHPNATHASYTLRAKVSDRCWYADAFRRDPEAKPEPRLRGSLASSRRQPGTEAVASVQQPRTTAAAPQPRTAPAASAQHPRATTAAPARRPAAIEYLALVAPWIKIAPGSSRLFPADDSPADFEGRFSAIEYKAPKW
jgi:hypothetical protein